MKIILNNNISTKNYVLETKELKSNSNIVSKTNYYAQVPFMGAESIQAQKTISSKIKHEREKLLKHLNDILKQEVPKLSNRAKYYEKLKSKVDFLKEKDRKRDELKKGIDVLKNSTFLSAKQQKEMANQLYKEMNRLIKSEPPEYKEKTPSKYNYDYALINKLRNAVLEDNYDFEKIIEDHYKKLNNITTAKEFKKQYPSLRVPEEAIEIISNKILNILNRDIFLELNTHLKNNSSSEATDFLINYFEDYFSNIMPIINPYLPNDKQALEKFYDRLGIKTIKKVLDKFEYLEITHSIDSVPLQRNTNIPQITEADKTFLSINYDNYIINTLKQIYLEGKKPNEIMYSDENVSFNIGSVKTPEYKFEKIPEKMKELIATSKKITSLQRDYSNFNIDELKSRLSYYSTKSLSDNEQIFNTMVEFDSCKYTQEDKLFLIKFLEILDKISDKTISLEDGIEQIHKNNIKPHGTNKLNLIEKQQAEENFKIERQKLKQLNQLREDFNDTINKLYELNLSHLVEKFTPYYPENLNEETINNTNKILHIIKESLKLEDPDKVNQQILRWEIFNSYSKDQNLNEIFKEALEYAKNFPEKDLENRAGQYLLSRELVDNFNENQFIFKNKDIPNKIIEKYGSDKALATSLLCKYDDYTMLDELEQKSILNILKIFNNKNPDEKNVLKFIVESEYINSDTVFLNDDVQHLPKTVLAAKAKQEILDKYKFPTCIDFFKAFEEAITTSATDKTSAGIQTVGRNNNSLEYKIEVKIKGFVDRLFSSKNDYVFDVYSERGLH